MPFRRPYVAGNKLRYISEAMVSGILLPRDKAELLERKAAMLKDLYSSHRGRVVYLTFDMAFMPQLTGIFSTPPYREMFGEIRGDQAFDDVIEMFLKRQPEIILVDDPSGPPAASGERRAFQEQLRKALSTAYRVVEIDSGWQVWQPAEPR